MKKSFNVLFLTLLFAVLLIPSVKADAATKPSTPSGLKLESQTGGKFGLAWTFDSNLLLEGDQYFYQSGYYYSQFGYEITIKRLNNKKIKTIDNNVTGSEWGNTFGFSTLDESIIKIIVTNNTMKKNGFKFSVRSYVYDSNGKKVYSDWSKEQVIIPRPTITKTKAKSKSSEYIKWDKVSGAKSYSIYVSSNWGASYKKKGTTKKTSYTLKGWKTYQEYYVYVVANGVKYKKKKYNSSKTIDKNSNCISRTIVLR